jgi:hypothetical protein
VTARNDRYAERRELVGAGWEPKDAGGTVVWRNPANGYWYPHELALDLAKGQAGKRAPKRP